MSFKTVLAAALTVSVIALSLPGDAEAGHRKHRHRHHGHGHGAAAAAIGLGFGVIIGSALSQPRYRSDDYNYDRPVRYRYRLRPWTAEWYRDCANRYRSFSPRTGRYLGYDGYYHFCR